MPADPFGEIQHVWEAPFGDRQAPWQVEKIGVTRANGDLGRHRAQL